MSIDEVIVLTSKEIITSIRSLTPDKDDGYILFPNEHYTPITDKLPDGTLVAYDALSDLWASQDMRIYAQTLSGKWIRKSVSYWKGFVYKPNNHSDYPRTNSHGRDVRVHWAVARAWLGPIPEGWEIDHIDGNNRNYNLSNLRLLPIWMNHRDGGFIKKLRHKKIDPGAFSQRNGRSGLRLRGEPNLYVRNMLLRFFKRMALFKSTNSDSAYNNLSHDALLRLLVSPEFTVSDPSARMDYDLTHHMEY